MKKRTISKLKSLFGSKKGKRQQQQDQSAKSSRSASPEPAGGSPCESYRPLIRTPPPSHVGPPPSPPVPTNPVAPVAPQPSGPLPLMPCLVCGRTFVPQSLAKHVKICEKTMAKKRKTFDSSRQRREGTDLEQYLPKNFGLPENSPFLEKSPPNTAKPTPKPKTQSVRSAIKKPMAELQKCPHCARAFGVRAFERHVEWCADKAKILPAAAAAQPPPHIADAKQRLNARTQYKAPLARARKSSQSRDKANSRSTSVDSSRGVSPPPPREAGDGKRRPRASESMSSNDCHDDTTPHVPVIRNSRTSQNNSGDANVKARQARLARDLSNTRQTRDSHFSPIQQSPTDPNIPKQVPTNKAKNRINVKRQQQLKKLDEIANKYNQKIEQEKNKPKNDVRPKNDLNDDENKSHIPVFKKIGIRVKTGTGGTDKMKTGLNSKKESVKEDAKRNVMTPENKNKIAASSVRRQTDTRSKFKQVKNDNKSSCTKESTMSLDSLDDFQLPLDKELLCPSVPCKIYNYPEQKRSENQKAKPDIREQPTAKNSNKFKASKEITPVIEFLYKNPNVNNTSDTQPIEIITTQTNCYDIESIDKNSTLSIKFDLHNELDNKKQEMIETNSEILLDIDENVTSRSHNQDLLNKPSDEGYDDLNNLSAEEFDDNYDHDLSAEMSNDSVEQIDIEQANKDVSRHGSSETYTKFSEDPADLEEFYNLTDKMISNKTVEEKVDEDIERLHTPNSISIEALNKNDPNLTTSDSAKRKFSDTLEELKNNLNQILNESNEVIIKNDDTQKNVQDMEHITVFGLKFYENNKPIENKHEDNVSTQLRLPSISETNNMMKKEQSLRSKSKPVKLQRKCKAFDRQNRNNIENKTFIVSDFQGDISDGQSISSEAPPLKLPRIETKRLDDNYDPFASAARQMKELMSSDTNIPKKLPSPPKELNRTLPTLRPNKDKTSPPPVTNNTKMMKDTLNKTYQKTPTLQRMKSFGSTVTDGKSSFGGRCSSFRINRNDKKGSSQKLNTTFTKSSKENISSTEKPNFNRNSNLNRSFSNYSSNYSTPKLKDKIPKIAPSMYHSFQRTTIKQPLKLDKIKNDNDKKDFVNLDSILSFDNASMTDSNYIDPRLINENDNLPINVNTILNNPDLISSMDSLLTTENLPAKFESFSVNNNSTKNGLSKTITVSNNINTYKSNTASMNELNSQYDKFMSSLEQSITSKTSVRDDESLCEDFDLEEFMTSFDEEVNKQKLENKRTYSSTTRIVKQSEVFDSRNTPNVNGDSNPKALNNRMLPVNKSTSLVFSNNNVKGEHLFPSSVKRSTSLLDSIQKKNTPNNDNSKSRHNKADQLEQDIMQSLKDFDKFYESERIENHQSTKEFVNCSKSVYNTTKKESGMKVERRNNKNAKMSNGHFSPSGKPSNDSAYSSLNRISPSKLSLCNSKDQNGLQLEQPQAGSDSNGSQKDEIRSISSEEFLAMERSAELSEPLPRVEAQYKDLANNNINEKRASSRASSQRSPLWRSRQELSSSGSETSLPRPKETSLPRLSRFCHECGNRFPVDTAKFCIECGVKRLVV